MAQLPFLDLASPSFSTRSEAVQNARALSWCARTPFGYAILRHQEAGNILRDRRLRQGSHNWPKTMGLEGSFADFWTRSIIGQEGPPHKALRRAAMSALSNEFILSLRSDFRAVADDLISNLKGRKKIEFIRDFTEPFAGRAITRLLALPDDMAAQVAHDASRLGLAMGPNAKLHEPVFNAACDRLMDLARHLVERARQGEDKQGFAARLVEAMSTENGHQEQALLDLIVISIFGGVDTTRAQLGFAIALFIENPRQWQALRASPTFVGPAIEEVIRTRPTTTWASREVVECFEMNGLQFDAGDLIHVLVHASGRDPLVVSDSDFDITAKRKLHFGFGGGAHHCLGQFVARTDMAEALGALSENWERIQWDGTPEYLPDSGNTSPANMPIKPVWA